MVLNLDDFQFSTITIKALSLGLKFATSMQRTSPQTPYKATTGIATPTFARVSSKESFPPLPLKQTIHPFLKDI